jgi:hypothetical protein
MANSTNDKRKVHARYAEHYLQMVTAAEDQDSRAIQCEMAAEWLRRPILFGAHSGAEECKWDDFGGLSQTHPIRSSFCRAMSQMPVTISDEPRDSRPFPCRLQANGPSIAVESGC